jgi:hypothetical protein
VSVDGEYSNVVVVILGLYPPEINAAVLVPVPAELSQAAGKFTSEAHTVPS